MDWRAGFHPSLLAVYLYLKLITHNFKLPPLVECPLGLSSFPLPTLECHCIYFVSFMLLKVVVATHSENPEHEIIIYHDALGKSFPWYSFFFFFFFFNKFIYLLFLAVWGLRFCVRAFSSCGERGPLFIAVRGPLTIAASLVAAPDAQAQ